MNNIEEKEILIRYGELTLKGENKKDFINQLRKNLELYIPKNELKVEYDRAFCKFSESNLNSLRYIFGISSYSIVYKTSNELKDIEQLVLKIARENTFKSFAIKARRHNKNYKLTSSELNMHFGGLILDNFENKTVDLTNANLFIYIEVRDKYTYVFSNYIDGLGGMPVSSSGKVLHLISGGIDSPVAANLLQKRGLKVAFLNFITPPHTDEKTTQKIDQIIQNLTKYQGSSTLFQINYTKLMNYIGLVSNQKYKITLMRRSFYRIAQKIAEKYNIKALSNGENLAQVASQTLESIYTISEVCNLPIFRPLLTFDKNETIKIAEKLGTMEISIQKACETCELFAPRFPVTKPTREEARKLENELDQIEKIEDEIIKQVEIKKFIL
ncbi:Probable tRNA sulfurtransferase [Mycoplasmopsis arginini]|uniref:tRNA uracil 4-sulfurtransferase ThiI n=1 Tax=Mycoplasmopsis arginini TaxID=2094 RepID=UPI000A27ACF6|nr:Probable tRNA sulfurtransferase [Chlamydia abortus]SGA06988.1 Probable tRNA sulfurtransferase [Mycoplasmopsis arginini]SGA29674.1 Probable tRNA sulfurtransferase [Mycoplasmopsis arginini]SGA31726.1 Probable tRNA sulfurtransferase [Chlamydia abortus]